MANPVLSVRVPQTVLNDIDEVAAAAGESRSNAAIRILLHGIPVVRRDDALTRAFLGGSADE